MAAPVRGGGPNDGWNDPPMISYNATSTTQGKSPSRSRSLLNRRVAFPLSSGNSDASQGKPLTGALLPPCNGPVITSPIQILPPTTSTSVNPPVPLVVPPVSPPIDSSALPPSFASAAKDPFKSETLPELLDRLQLEDGDALRKYTKKMLHETVDKLKDSRQGRSREDVQQRLGVLDDQWRDEKISEGAKVKLGCLASAIQNDDLKCADSLHLSLMVDHISEVSQWMVGVKRLINELKLLQPLPASTFVKVGEASTDRLVPNPSGANNNNNNNPATDSCNSNSNHSAEPNDNDNKQGDVENVEECNDSSNNKPPEKPATTTTPDEDAKSSLSSS